jgi:hypothetical protein
MMWTGVVLLAVAGSGAALYKGCESAFDGMCGNDLIHEELSPDGKVKVVVFQRDCGATTGFSTQVSIVPGRKTLPNAPGNVFVATTGHGAAPTGQGGGPEVRVVWDGNQTLILKHHPSAAIFKAEREHSGVRIVVEHLP